MKHKKRVRKFSLKTGPRGALIRSLVRAVLRSGDPAKGRPSRITTTVTRAKEAQAHLEHLITLAKKGTLHHRRLAYQQLQDWSLVRKLFTDIAPLFADRRGGYTRVLRLEKRRLNDSVPLAILELVETGTAEPKAEPGKAEKPPAPQQTQKTES